jgi:hypothetical protein
MEPFTKRHKRVPPLENDATRARPRLVLTFALKGPCVRREVSDLQGRLSTEGASLG